MTNHPNRSSKPIHISFQRDGHSDSILVKRNDQPAAHIYWRPIDKQWQVVAHGAQVVTDGSMRTLIGRVQAFTYAGDGLAIWSKLAPFPTLWEALQALIDSDPRALKRDAKGDANYLLTRFHQYTSYKDAA